MISRSLKHISNAVTNPTNWFVAACFAVCLFSTMRLLDTRPISISQTADAAEASARNSAHLRTNSELDAAKTLGLDSIVSSDGRHSAAVKSKTVLTPIEELEVGMRVRADSPNGEFDDQFGTEVIPSKWRKLTLTSPKKNGTLSHITLLRPLDWIEREKAVVDGYVYVTVPECGIDGNARIHAIEPCPKIPKGDGQVITGTFRHQADGGVELKVEGEPEPILCTGNHPFWSVDRRAYVRADVLSKGETLLVNSGVTSVISCTQALNVEPVHNIEVHFYHTYRVGSSGIFVHNGGVLLPIIGGNCFVPLDEVHHASFELSGVRGAVIASGDEVSGVNFALKNGQRLSFPEQSWFGHTEGKIIDDLISAGKLSAGKTLTITGQRPPCSQCKNIMQWTSKAYNVTVRYLDAEGKIWWFVNGARAGG